MHFLNFSTGTEILLFIRLTSPRPKYFNMEITLKLISGICWSTVYIALIYNGFKHKNYGMPFIALALNISWEGIYSFYHFNPADISLQRWINIFWFVFDLFIVYQYFRYGQKYFSKKISPNLFIPWSIIALLICFTVEYMFLVEFGVRPGAKYSAFLQNLIMSFLFIDMLLRRNDIAGFSMTVAICKWIGTLAPTILFGMENSFILVVGLFCCLIDMIYIALLFYMKRKASNPEPLAA